MPRAFIVVGLGFGDEGKGATVDALVRRYNAGLVVRYNGGAQAGHNVVDALTGNHHCFAQLGAGTFVPGCRTLLGSPVLVNPLAMLHEEDHLSSKGVVNAFSRLSVDGRCLMTTPYHRALNRLRELARGSKRHGSCGMGIGETVAYGQASSAMAPRIGDILHPDRLMAKLSLQRMVCQGTVPQFALDTSDKLVEKELSTFDVEPADLLRRYLEWAAKVAILLPMEVTELIGAQETVVFEGAQGILLDEDYGFHPYTTWSSTTTKGANLILDEVEWRHPRTVVGAVRAYMTRHGAGPFPTEDPLLTRALPDKYNPENPWQARLRCGWMDLPLLSYALSVQRRHGAVDLLSVSCLDQTECLDAYRYSSSLGLDLTPPDPSAFPARREWTRRLATEAKPVMQSMAPKSQNVVSLLEEMLEVRVGMYAQGRTAMERTFVTNVFACH